MGEVTMFDRSRAVQFASFLVAVGLCACAGRDPSLDDQPSREFAGHYSAAEGGSWFRPCDISPTEAAGWVTFTGRSVEQMQAERAAGHFTDGPSYFVRWRASVTYDGEVGPRGPGKPALLVRELLELRPASDDDCAGWGGADER
jgi:hypothetical protein